MRFVTTCRRTRPASVSTPCVSLTCVPLPQVAPVVSTPLPPCAAMKPGRERTTSLRKATTHQGGFPAASAFLGTNPEQPAYLLDSALVLPLRLQRRLQADGLAKFEDANIPSKGTSPTSELLARAVVKWHG